MKFIVILRLALTVALLVAVGMTIESRHAADTRSRSRAMLRVGLEDVAGRIRSTSRNLELLRALSDSAALAKARSLARLVASGGVTLTDQAALEATARALDVDELHISDSNGVLIASVPASIKGYVMASQPQSAQFLPAIHDKTFEFVQEPMFRGLDNGEKKAENFFQYVGVARIEEPGIIEIGYRNSRLEAAMQLADVSEIARTTRLGLDGKVMIRERPETPPAEGFVREKDEDGRSCVALETDCEGYRVRVRAPESCSFLAGEDVFDELLVADIILALLLWLAFPGLHSNFRGDIQALKEMFGGRFRAQGSFRRVLRNPVTIACALAFLGATVVAWLMMTRSSYRAAQTRLLAAAADIREAVDNCADNLLFYQGQAMVNLYKKPEAMTFGTAQDLMRQYGLDELNVVNSEGVVLIGALADVGFDFHSNEKTRPFLCLLAGQKTYAQPFRAPIEDPNGMRRKYAGIAFPYPAKGFIQIGFDESRLRHGIDYWFHDLAKDRHIGEHGYHLVADVETGDVLSCGVTDEKGRMRFQGGLTLAAIGFDVAAVPQKADEFFTATLFGEKCLCLSEVRNYHRLVSAIPFREIRGGVWHVILLSSAVLFCVFTLVVFFMTKLTNLIVSLREKERAERERQEKDLAVARTIQTSSLPPSFPDRPEWRLFAQMDTAREVGGDFFDYSVMPSGKIFFLIADVSGKGIPAAMFMMKAKTTIRACVYENATLAEAIAEANSRLAENNDANMFVTAWFGLFDLATGELEYVNAGHNPPLLKRADGRVEWIRGKRGLVLAAMEGVPYRVERMTLNCGDALLLYTDGVTEAMNAAGELYGEPRLEQTLASSGERFLAEVRADVAAFVNGAEQSDDITMLAFDYKQIPTINER